MNIVYYINKKGDVFMFCYKCGKEIPDTSTFCSHCGTAVKVNKENTNSKNETSEKVYSTPQTATNNDSNDKLMGILAYLGILVLIPIFAAKDSKFARFHANQGLINSIFCVAYAITVTIINGLLFAILPWTMMGLYGIIATILQLGNIYFVVMMIIGIVNVCNGNTKELPIYGKIKILK